MKKNTLFFLLATLLLVNFPSSGFAYKTGLYGMYGNFTKADNGVLTINSNSGNNLTLSQIKAAAFTYEAKVNILEGDRVSFVFGYTGTGFYGIELCLIDGDKVSLKGFRDGDASGMLFQDVQVSVNKSQPIPFKISVTAEGLLTVYAEGNQVHQMTIPAYQTGYLGALTFQSKVELSDVMLNLEGDEGYRGDLNGLTGEFSTKKSVYTLNRKGNSDNFILSQTEATALSVEGNIQILDGDRMSFVYGYKDGGDWHAAELRVVSSTRVALKAFKVGNNGGDLFNEEFDVNTTQPVLYKINIDADGQLSVFLNGIQVKQAKYDFYSGGRWGMLTWNTKAVLSDPVVEIKDAGNAHLVDQSEMDHLCGQDNAYNKTDISYIINKTDGNNFVSSLTLASDFSYEGKIQIPEGDRLSFVFGATGNITENWFGTELRVVNGSKVAIKAFKEGEAALFDQEFDVDTTQPIPLKITVSLSGQLTVYLNGVEVKQATFPTYTPGHLGFLTFNSKALVSDVLVILHPQVTVLETSLTGMQCIIGSPITQNIHISGKNLTGDISILSDNNVFTISPSMITPINGVIENQEVSITFNPLAAGIHTGTLTITSSGIQALSRNLNGVASTISSIPETKLHSESLVYAENNKIIIRMNSNNTLMATAYNAEGQIVAKEQLSNQYSVLKPTLKSGLYLVQIDNNGIVETKKVIIQ